MLARISKFSTSLSGTAPYWNNSYHVGSQEVRTGKSHILKTNSIEVTGNVFARGDTEAAVALDDVFLVSGAGRTRILKSAASSPFARFRDSAAETLSRGLAAHPRERDLILAMTLGLKSAIPRETMDVFRRAGTIHVFAISGLHVGAIALMINSFFPGDEAEARPRQANTGK